jgi:hypothetical protein
LGDRQGLIGDFPSLLRHAPLDQGEQKGSTMLNDPLFIVAALATFGVLVILMIGIGGFAKGGEFNKKHANRVMRYRIAAQAVAVLLIVGFAWIRSNGGN